MEVRKQVLPKNLIWKEEEPGQEAKQKEQAVNALAQGAVNGAAKGVAAARQWQMVNRNDKPRAIAAPKAAGPVIQPVKAQKNAPPQPNPMSAYDPLVKIAKSLPTISPANKLAQEPLYNSRDAANLYNALS